MDIAQIPEAAHDWPDKVPDFAPLKINLGNQDSISDRRSDAGGAFFFSTAAATGASAGE
jgi:hypothetical protein